MGKQVLVDLEFLQHILAHCSMAGRGDASPEEFRIIYQQLHAIVEEAESEPEKKPE